MVSNSAVEGSRSSALMAPLLRESASGFFLRLIILLGLFAFIVLPLPSGVKNLLTDSTARVAGVVLQMIGYKVTSVGQFVLGDNFSVEVILRCTGFFEAIIFSACVLAYPTTFAKKLFGLCLGLGIIYWFNILRIVGAFLIGVSYPTYFELSHTYMFNSLSLALMVMLWIYWIDRVAGQEGMNNKLHPLQKGKESQLSPPLMGGGRGRVAFFTPTLPSPIKGEEATTRSPWLCTTLFQRPQVVSFLGRFLLSSALLTILWTKVSGAYWLLLKTVVSAILPMVGLTQGTQVVVYRFQATDIVGFSIVGTIAFIFCLSQGRYLRRIMLCCMALMGLFGLNVLQGLCYILGTFYTSDWLIRTGNVLIVGIMVAPFVVALALLYRSSNKSEWQNQSLGSGDIESRSLKSSADL